MTTLIQEVFTHDEITAAVNASPRSIAKAAQSLSELGRGEITPQLLRQYIARADHTVLSSGYDRARELVRSRNAMVENNKLRADVRSLADALGTRNAFLDAVDGVAVRLPKRAPSFNTVVIPKGTRLTAEILLSDLQIGKLAPGFNTEIARKRLFEMGRAAVFQIRQKQLAGYNVERIVLGLLGDIIESDKKHKNSARATDTGTSEQIADAITGIFEFIVEPLGQLGIPMDVHCIPGNHDHDDHGLNMFEPGKQHLSWALYQSLRIISDRAGYGQIMRWFIPEGSYSVTDFYGQYALYEHGVGVSATESSMVSHKIKRSEQERKHLTYFRMGDKHTVCSFNAGQLVVNGSFFGAVMGGKEYSGIAGYSSVPAQWMGFHTPRKDARTTLYDSFVIQLDHIGE